MKFSRIGVCVGLVFGLGCTDEPAAEGDTMTTAETGDGDGDPGDGDGDGDPGDGDGDGDSGDGDGDGDSGDGDGDGDSGDGDGDGDGDPLECSDPAPEWIFCDDFESDGPMVADGRYFEYGDDEGDVVVTPGAGYGGSQGIRTHFEAGEVEAGGMKLGFGRNPNGYMNKGIRPNEDFREIWYRMYLRNDDGWTGNPAKLSRATIFSSADDWSQAMIAHLWSDGNERLLLDPVSCIENGQVVCQGYNDFANMSWLGNLSGQTPVFSTALSGQWFCVEAHVKLNDPGMQNGVQEFWINGELEARRDEMDFVGTWTEYGINAVFFENYWNDGSAQDQGRDFDNIVVSTAPIGCL
ncbi:Endo-1,4-beta-xylanase A precursor [Enhygromyxa salina]|uniref:Endo-1,4-beta-xylanase A n=1 Tax=Enhygromyxa salina TaxID=215803 RepID=A0A0C2CW15_9BACT|nr:hypothetical protein [Enhygromyxa salina]KIG15226.1 Endo-1,4-beta-xylanase A precursor [Enhygromyxa salina]